MCHGNIDRIFVCRKHPIKSWILSYDQQLASTIADEKEAFFQCAHGSSDAFRGRLYMLDWRGACVVDPDCLLALNLDARFHRAPLCTSGLSFTAVESLASKRPR